MPQSQSPYADLPSNRYWRSAVAEPRGSLFKTLYSRKFDISRQSKIATAGSCFAQHIGRNLRKFGFTVLDAEPAPAGLPESAHAGFGFGLFSARYGNIYTTRQLLQLVTEAFGDFAPS